MTKMAEPKVSIVGERALYFWAGCAAISVGVLLHLPMWAMAHEMGNRLAGIPMDVSMHVGMALIAVGAPLACYGALPKKHAPHGDYAGTSFEAPDSTPLNRWHAATLLVLTLGLISPPRSVSCCQEWRRNMASTDRR